jgi:hypothetical protein
MNSGQTGSVRTRAQPHRSLSAPLPLTSSRRRLQPAPVDGNGVPERDGDERLIQSPADGQLEDSFAAILLRKAVEPLYGFQVLGIAGRMKCLVHLTTIVALKFTVR